MDALNLQFRLDADASGLSREASRAGRVLNALAMGQKQLERYGLYTADALRAEAAAMDRLGGAMGRSSLAARRLETAKRGLGASARQAGGELAGAATGARTAAGAMGALGKSLAAVGAGLALEALRRGAAEIYRLGTAAEETESKFNTVFGAISAQVDAFGRGFFNVAGMTQTEGRGMVATFGALAQGMGITGQAGAEYFQRLTEIDPAFRRVGEASADTSIAVVRLAADLASFNNADISEVLENLQSGLTGEVEPLRKYGIELDAVAVSALALETTGKRNAKELTNTDKILARLVLAYQRAGVAVGDLDRTQGSLANRTRFLAASAREEAEIFSRSLVPAMGQVISYGTDLINQNRAGARSFGETFAGGIRSALTATLEIGDAYIGLAQTFGNAVTSLLRLTGVLREGEGISKVFSAAQGGIIFAVDAVSLVVSRATAGLLAMNKAWLELNARISYNNGDLEEYARLQTQAVLAARELERFVTAQVAAETERDTRRANLRADLQASSVAASALSASLLDADAATSSVTEKAAKQQTALEEQEARQRAILEEVQYLLSAEGQRAAMIERQNALLSSQAQALRGTQGVTPAAPRALPATPGQPGGGEIADAARQSLAEMQGAYSDTFSAVESRAITAYESMQQGAYRFASGFRDVMGVVSVAGSSIFGSLSSAASDYFEASGRQSKAAFSVYKGVSVAQSLIATYEGATKAYTSLASIPVVGPALGAAAAAAAVVAGLANVAKIRQMQPGGGGGGGSSYSAPVSSGGSSRSASYTGPAPAAATAPSFDDANRQAGEAVAAAVESAFSNAVLTGTLRAEGTELVAAVSATTRKFAAIGQ